jgi:hypothetical protein
MSETSVSVNLYPVTEELKKIREYLKGDLKKEFDDLERANTNNISQLNENMVKGFNNIAQMNNELTNQVSNLVRILNDQTKQNQILIERTEQVQKEVARGTEVQANSFILQIAGKLFTQLGLINSQKNRIDKQYVKSFGRIAKVTQKFDILYSDIEESYKRDVHRLGKHILSIQKNFQNFIENRLKSYDFGFFKSVKKSMEDVGEIRRNLVEENLDGTLQKVNGFIEQRKHYHESVAEVKIDEVKLPNQSISIPVTVTISKEDANREIAYIGTDLKETSDSSVSFKLEAGDWFQSYQNPNIQYEASIRWREMTDSEKAEILKEFDALAEEGLVSEEYKLAFKEALNFQPPRVPESVGELVVKNLSGQGVNHG